MLPQIIKEGKEWKACQFIESFSSWNVAVLIPFAVHLEIEFTPGQQSLAWDPEEC